jgi:hypothetical protein
MRKGAESQGGEMQGQWGRGGVEIGFLVSMHTLSEKTRFQGLAAKLPSV